MAEDTWIMGEAERKQSVDRSLPRRPRTATPGYECMQLLGRGAFGEVWRALDKNTNVAVAIKFYTHPGGLDWSLLSREVDKLRMLSNDTSVVKLLSVGWEADPPYYVMEYLQKGSLEDRIKRQGPMAAGEAVPLFREIARGLLNVHNKGVLHCDLKPANILLDDNGKPRLADFGQARLHSEQSQTLGTLFFMAPEQADPKAMPSASWDVYALGAVLYFMLVGEAPHHSRELLQELQQIRKLDERLRRYRRYLREAKPPTTHRTLPDVPRGLADIVSRCLAIDPKQRYANVQAVLDALDAWSLRQARRPLLVVGIAGSIALILVLSGLAYNAFNRTMHESRFAVQERVRESNHFAASSVAQRMALDFDRRWRILEFAASQEDVRKDLAEIASLEVGSQEYRALQKRVHAWLQAQGERFNRGFKAEARPASWLVCDARGIQIARVPLPDANAGATVDHSFAHRDYFHGKGQDLAPGIRAPALQKPHLSVVFRSAATDKLVVGFSAPIPAIAPRADPRPVGVIVMTVELGKLAELRYANHQRVVLIDTRPEGITQKRGLIVEHPSLIASIGRDPFRFVADDVAQQATKLRDARLNNPEQTVFRDLNFVEEYVDPFDPPPEIPWMLSMEPIITDDASKYPKYDTGLVVLVQEPQEQAFHAVNHLRKHLLRLGLRALGIVTLVIFALWGFVLMLFSDSSRSKIAAILRRRAGVRSPVSDPGRSGGYPAPSAGDSSPRLSGGGSSAASGFARPPDSNRSGGSGTQ